jgi:hypothetical protein
LSATFVLIHSPFLGPLSWRAVHGALRKRGEAALLLDLRQALSVRSQFYEAFAATAARQIGDPSILVAHSGAGALVPAILGRAKGLAQGAIFVDAILPHPGRSWFDTAPIDLAKRLRAGARAGRAPPWPSWWAKEAMAQLLPDRRARERFARSAPAVPLAYLEEPAPACAASAPPRCYGYVQLSSSYDAQADRARALGWPMARVHGHHLSAMTEPDLVAAAIVMVASRLPP